MSKHGHLILCMYVLAEITFFPQKAWVVSSATCTEGLFAAPHTVCRPSYATLCLSRGATRCEWQGALPITLPLILPLFLIVVFFFKPLSVLFFLSLEIKRLQGAPHCLCSTFQQSIFLDEKSGLQLACNTVLLVECEGWSGEEEDDTSFVVSGLLVCSVSS